MQATVRALLVLLHLFILPTATAQSRVFNVRQYGAVGDGKRNNTAAVRAAAFALKSHGGGTLLFPHGHWVTGTSSVSLSLPHIYS